MFKNTVMIVMMLVAQGCVEHTPTSTLLDDVDNPEIWVNASNKSASTTSAPNANSVAGSELDSYDLLVSTPEEKEKLTICVADHPDKCVEGAEQYHYVEKRTDINHPDSIFLIENFKIRENTTFSIRAWKEGDLEAYGRIITVLAQTSASPGPGGGSGAPNGNP